MPRLGNLKLALAPAALCALALAACGSQQQRPRVTATSPATKGSAHDNDTVWVYSSLPQGGPERAHSLHVQQGIRLALDRVDHHVRGAAHDLFQVHYAALNDSFTRVVHRRLRGPSSPVAGSRQRSTITTVSVGNTNGWNAKATVQAAERAARNPQTIAYIGDLDSGATELSLPILNQAGIVQITPGSGYPGLTDSYKGVTQAPEPGKYYPQSTHTLLRLIPNDVVQASAALQLLHGGGCQHVAIWEFARSLESDALANAIALTAPRYRMAVFKTEALPPVGKGYAPYQAYALALRNDIRCAVMVGRVTSAAVMLTTALRQQLGIPVLGTDGLCNSGWVRGIPGIVKAEAKTIIAGLYCMTPVLPVAHYPGTRGPRGFIALFSRAYHHRPDAYAYFGYQAAEMVLRALRAVGRNQDNRQQLVLDLIDDFVPEATGALIFDPHGNIDSQAYGVDVFVNGVPRWSRTLTPPAENLLSSA